MAYKVDLNDLKAQYIGKTYAFLTVVDVIRDCGIKLICRCKCGTTKVYNKSKVINGYILSCGCYTSLKKSEFVEDLKKEYIGKVFHWLTVLDVYRREDTSVVAKCACVCGREIEVYPRSLKTGHVMSCGCYRRSSEKAEKSRQWRKENPDKVAAINEKHSQWFKDNPDKVAEQVAKRSQWCKDNPDKVAEQASKHSEWYSCNRERTAELGKKHSQWFKDNPDKVAEMVRHRKETMSNNDYSEVHIAHSNLYKCRRVERLKELRNNPTSDFTEFLDLLDPHDADRLFAGEISSHGTVMTRCRICGKYYGHILKNIFVLNTGTYKHKIAPLCDDCVGNVMASPCEDEIADYIATFYDEAPVKNSRAIIAPFELDLYYSDAKIAIEYNGDYWHSTLFKHKDYHYNKFITCLNNGILLVSIFESEWATKHDLIKQYLHDTFNNTDNNLSFDNGYMNNNYPCRHVAIDSHDIITASYCNGNSIVYTCGLSKIISLSQ